jgi:DNA-binding MarR family transcriptional regulator
MIPVGYLKLHRKLRENPVVMKDAEHLAVWIWLLTEAVFAPTKVTFHGEQIVLQPGQLTTGRNKIASDLKISASKVQRILKRFESEHQIEQRTDRQCRLITIVSWDEYQMSEQRNEHQMNNERTTSEQRVNTKEENKEYKNKRNHYYTADEIWERFNLDSLIGDA